MLAALAYSIRLQWTQVRASLDELTIISSLGAIGLSLAALGAAVMALREVLVGLGTVLSTRAALCIYAMSQLAKYVPGGIWPVVVQMQVGRVFDVPRHRSAAAFFLTLGASAAVATALGGLLALTGDGMGLFVRIPAPVPCPVPPGCPRTRPPTERAGTGASARNVSRRTQSGELVATSLASDGSSHHRVVERRGRRCPAHTSHRGCGSVLGSGSCRHLRSRWGWRPRAAFLRSCCRHSSVSEPH